MDSYLTDEERQWKQMCEKARGPLTAGLDLPGCANNNPDKRLVWQDSLLVADFRSMWCAPEVSEADAAFYAMARTALPALLSKVAQQAEEIEGLRRGRGWRCFLCDEVFTDETEAREHFGTDEYELPRTPGCIDPLRSDEKARLKALHEAEEHAMQMQRDAEENDEALGLLEIYRSEIGRYFGECGGTLASTPHQAWLKLEAAQNEAEAWKARAEAAELRVVELEKALGDCEYAIRKFTHADSEEHWTQIQEAADRAEAATRGGSHGK